ncbi:hypothetical protein Q9L42_012390 [Methylomarinum sp. Ch1-1]|uniref:Uncharacterized protein n=1 Tax=Methylomarinum roseum TaxID=3067653 RepID=A0AAU7NQC1_9GAMM|nr:hypothetical protein [Methylomarinum sp. Ch1-1]MDP4520894.1 hypothetical protein [Methylomarinum sp. Ch1-1]
MMHVALDRTLILLIEHKELMFRLIDYMDGNQRRDLPAEVFFNSLRAKLESLASRTESERLGDAFDLDNLIKTGIVAEFNQSRGTIALQPAVLDIFRLFDKERVRGLRSAELENIRIQLENAYRQHQTLSFADDNIAFLEQRDHLFDLLRRINSQIQNNTAHLQHQADRLSKRLDHDPTLLSLDESRQHRDMLVQVKQIYDREIIPTLEFLNSREYSKVKAPLILIDELSRLYDLRGYEDDSYYIDQYKLSILSHYKSVEKVKQTLQRYLHQERRHRLTYNAIEQAYLHLQQLAQGTFTEKLKDKYIFKALEQDMLYFNGLKTHAAAQDARIEWNPRNHVIYFNEYLVNRQARRRSDSPAEITTFDKERLTEPNNALKRRIRQLVDLCHIEPPVDDLYAELHHYLAEHLSRDYQLPYLLYGVSCFKQRHGAKFKIKVAFERPQRRIRYHNHVLEYNKRLLSDD